MNNKKRQRLMVRYLMGEVSDMERDALEEEYIRNREVLAELVSLENDLADAYACGEFSRADARRFESYLTTPARRRKSLFAKVLMDYISSRPDKDRSLQRYPASSIQGFFAGISPSAIVLACLIVIAIGAASWLLAADLRLHQAFRQEIRDLRDKQEQLAQRLAKPATEMRAGPPVISPKKEIRPVSSSPVIASLQLSPHFTRGTTQATILHLSPAISSVKITLSLEHDNYSAYAVLVKPAEGPSVWKYRPLHSFHNRQSIPVVPFQLPSKVLQNGDYVVKLSGVTESSGDDDLGAYTFRVIRP